ncbi:prepilin-type N-terminal cleavage/methylation domain-containing protein [Vibrio splendidus]|uniref:prepilin-type N-terminal cleavage/methylation domain-containing protein n=1 Tax=Vibrio splendidus TaxID=29497 RepID=UPI0021B34D05|nr:prepilin-type N-terminal cleavage/methylation domain-containing protein [Vibrio splendidus]UWZ98589.1 prepilin-type N-terminal cleavage/methylation domain-containing protein [Vibrio splendidus]
MLGSSIKAFERRSNNGFVLMELIIAIGIISIIAVSIASQQKKDLDQKIIVRSSKEISILISEIVYLLTEIDVSNHDDVEVINPFLISKDINEVESIKLERKSDLSIFKSSFCHLGKIGQGSVHGKDIVACSRTNKYGGVSIENIKINYQSPWSANRGVGRQVKNVVVNVYSKDYLALKEVAESSVDIFDSGVGEKNSNLKIYLTEGRVNPSPILDINGDKVSVEELPLYLKRTDVGLAIEVYPSKYTFLEKDGGVLMEEKASFCWEGTDGICVSKKRGNMEINSDLVSKGNLIATQEFKDGTVKLTTPPSFSRGHFKSRSSYNVSHPVCPTVELNGVDVNLAPRINVSQESFLTTSRVDLGDPSQPTFEKSCLDDKSGCLDYLGGVWFAYRDIGDSWEIISQIAGSIDGKVDVKANDSGVAFNYAVWCEYVQ